MWELWYWGRQDWPCGALSKTRKAARPSAEGIAVNATAAIKAAVFMIRDFIDAVKNLITYKF